MPYALKRDEAVADAFRRVTTELCDDAVAQLHRGGDAAAAVHATRKAMKRIRAAARLVRPALSSGGYRAVNTRARDAARLLAGHRDAHVVSATVAAVVATANDPAVYDDLRAALPREDATPQPEVVESAVAVLSQLRADLVDVTLDDGWGAVPAGIEAIYRRGAKAMSAAAGKTTATRLHEWRKHTKYLWHAVELVTPSWPAVLGPLGDELHALSDNLGDDHDLDVASGHVAASYPAMPAGWDELVAARHSRLRTAAFSRGLRVYAEAPEAFGRRMRAYTEAWLAG